MASKYPVALTIAGSDPSGGAGIQADLKTFHQFGVYGEAVITLLTVQNTTGVKGLAYFDPALVERQLEAVLSDIPPGAAKTGALASVEIIEIVADYAARFTFPLVVDPVVISKNGAPLLSGDGCKALVEKLLPHTFLLTPNLPEARILTGIEVHDPSTMMQAAERLVDMGAKNVLVKGGHLDGAATDILLCDGSWYEIEGPRISTPHTHGTGCTYSAALTACLAKGITLPDAFRICKRFIEEAIRTAPGLGHGVGPVNHHAPIETSAPPTRPVPRAARRRRR